MIDKFIGRLAAGGLAALLCAIAVNVQAAPGLMKGNPFLAGGDVSVLTLMENNGARYTDREGRESDALSILAAAGHNIVRLRLYDQPGPGHGNDGWHWPAGSQDLDDLLALAKRSADLGLQIQLTIHYSDFWTNGGLQNVPFAWRDELAAIADEGQRFERVRELVYERTREVMAAMKEQGTPPQFVSLGNEIAGGILFPYGELFPNGQANPQGWKRVAALLQAGHDAVKSVSPAAQVVIHLDDGGNVGKYTWFFDNLKAHGVQWDVIGASYYPFWTGKTVGQMANFAKVVTARYKKELLVMEAGFNWAPTRPDGWPGQLTHNGPYPESMSSPEGQKAFVEELLGRMKATPHVLGVLYWDPVMIATPGVGWAVWENGTPGANVVSNTTLFDFEGRALPVLDNWKTYTAPKRK
jgi:arabinogalactan endo-1,4-beta-galactosidase